MTDTNNIQGDQPGNRDVMLPVAMIMGLLTGLFMADLVISPKPEHPAVLVMFWGWTAMFAVFTAYLLGCAIVDYASDRD